MIQVVELMVDRLNKAGADEERSDAFLALARSAFLGDRESIIRLLVPLEQEAELWSKRNTALANEVTERVRAMLIAALPTIL